MHKLPVLSGLDVTSRIKDADSSLRNPYAALPSIPSRALRKESHLGEKSRRLMIT